MLPDPGHDVIVSQREQYGEVVVSSNQEWGKLWETEDQDCGEVCDGADLCVGGEILQGGVAEYDQGSQHQAGQHVDHQQVQNEAANLIEKLFTSRSGYSGTFIISFRIISVCPRSNWTKISVIPAISK